MAQPNYSLPEYMVNPGGNIAATIQRSRQLSAQEAAEKFAQQQDAARLLMQQNEAGLRQTQMEQGIQAAASRLVSQKKYNDLIAQGVEPYSAAVQSGMMIPRVPTGTPTQSSVTVDGRSIPYVVEPGGRVHFPPSSAVTAQRGKTEQGTIPMPGGVTIPYITDPRGVPHFPPAPLIQPKATIPKSYVAPGQGIVERQGDGTWKQVFAFNPKSKLSESEQAQNWILRENVRAAQARLKQARHDGNDGDTNPAQLEYENAVKQLRQWADGLGGPTKSPQASTPTPNDEKSWQKSTVKPASARLPDGVTPDQAIEQARAAIAAGKDPAAINSRLKSWGLNPIQ